MKIISQIPNAITLANLACGFAAIVYGFDGQFRLAMMLILLGAAFDFFDGLSARVLNVKSDIGAQLDSFSDLVTFGIAPAVLIYVWIDWITGYHLMLDNIEFLKLHEVSKQNSLNFGAAGINLKALMISVLIPIAGAIRLAKFNVSNDTGGAFRGMAMPIAGIFLASLSVICIHFYSDQNEFGLSVLTNKYIISLIVLCTVFLMVSNIPMFSFKMKSISIKENPFQFLLMICIVLAILAGLLIKNIWISIPIIVVLYILLSVVKNLLKR